MNTCIITQSKPISNQFITQNFDYTYTWGNKAGQPNESTHGLSIQSYKSWLENVEYLDLGIKKQGQGTILNTLCEKSQQKRIFFKKECIYAYN